MFEKIVIVTRKTRLEGLIERFNSKGQAKFYIEHAGGDFSVYQKEHDAYSRSLDTLRKSMDLGLKLQVLDRRIVPTYMFSDEDLVVPIGQDGLVANVAKYVGRQPIVGINPDPERFDGILLPFVAKDARPAVERTLEGKSRLRDVTLAEVELNDGQKLRAFNDFFIGTKSHVSARYRIHFGGRSEPHSSSGVLVSTGAGSTGWLSSVFNMVSAIAGCRKSIRMKWDDPRLFFVVREPYKSLHSAANIVAGFVDRELRVESRMPQNGVIFSDGVEKDYLDFNSGAVAAICAAKEGARLVVAA